LAEQLVHPLEVVHPGPLVLGATLLNLPTPTADRDRTVSRRSEPSSRTALNGEQPYPWDLLQPQDAMSRHRGAKPPRRCELLGEISPVIPGVPFIPLKRWAPSTQKPTRESTNGTRTFRSSWLPELWSWSFRQG